MCKLDNEDLRRSAIVFSPHPDDETLGCGGTIIKKKKAGANVKIIFITDGSLSHPHLISAKKMKSIRAKEAVAASRILGVEEKDVFFLEFEDTKLSKKKNSVIPKVIEILLHEEPDEVFIPYHRDTHPDHIATNETVLSALQNYGKKVIIYEYPIWIWRYWPWVYTSLETSGPWINNLISGFYLLRDFQCSIYIADYLDQKCAALVQYKSQMTRLIPDPNWWTLNDISNGEFLKCFFQDHEIFYRYIFHRKKASPNSRITRR
jgi:LmbE family N-acetylglucosaminyl deacetylase